MPSKSFGMVSEKSDDQISRFDSRFLLSPHGDPLMGILIMYNFGGPSSTSSTRPLVERRAAGLTNSSTGGLGVSCNVPVTPTKLT